MQNVMIDIESMSTQLNAAIISLGAVTFDLPGSRIGERFYARIDLESAMASGGVVDASTIMWWLQQSDVARGEFAGDVRGIRTALLDFATWLSANAGDEVLVWGNGSDFDNVILRQSYCRLGMKLPWKYRNNRCFRTIKNVYPPVEIDWEGTAHKAVDDAERQARYLMALWTKEGL